MTRWRQVATIAWWEFNRFVKWRQQLIGVLVMLGVGGLGTAVQQMVSGARAGRFDVAVVGAERLGYALPDVDGITWLTNRYTTVSDAQAGVAADSVAGVLLIDSTGRAEVVVRKKSAWTARLAPAFTAASHTALYSQLAISPETRRALSTPFPIAVTMLGGGGSADSRSSRLYANILLAIGMLILFNGFASLFAGITGEKQQRITEQMLSMVPPQSWIDGKIIGLAGAALAGTLSLAATGLLAFTLIPRLVGKTAMSIPPLPTELGLLALIALITVLGTAMWFAFMAAIAATIDDPNSSPRSAMLMVPILPSILAFLLVARAESSVAQAFAIFPLTSMAVLPVRLLATSVPWWEPTLAVILLALSAWAFRRAAGKIFAVGVLLHGKEPSMAETLRWAREA